jgi:hypothetical protein
MRQRKNHPSRILLAAAILVYPLHAAAQDSPALENPVPGAADPLSPPASADDLGISSGILRRAPVLPPVSPSSLTKTVLSLNAFFAEGAPNIRSGLQWRIFSDQPDVNGNHALVFESTDPRPLVTLDPGGYICHVSYGLVSATRHVVLGSVATSENIVLNAGAISFSGTVAGKPIPAEQLAFDIHKSAVQLDELVASAQAGEIVRLPAGSYQITSTYGTANARITSEMRVEAGKLTEAAVLHKAGRVELRLKNPDGTEVVDASWSILTPGGDVVSESVPDLGNVVLAEGDYVAVARSEGKVVQKPFEVVSGRDETIELARN